MSQFTVDVSLASELMTNDVLFTILDTGAERFPRVPPGVLRVSMIIAPVLTAVVEIVIVPGVPDKAADVPRVALAPVLICKPLPAVSATRFPFVA
jgi:hypothetical protein